jgi:hypothetical protein
VFICIPVPHSLHLNTFPNFDKTQPQMDKKSLKLDLVQRLLLTESDEVLGEVKKLLQAEEAVEFNKAQKKELDARKQRHLDGKSRSYTWDEVKSLARSAMRK